MDELIDIVDIKGKPTGDTCMKSVAHQNGILHASSHIWFYTVTGEILIQKRSKSKEIYPDLWDVSVAGHIAAGEISIKSAIREIKEEIGLDISEKELSYQGIWIEKHEHTNGLIDNEVHHIYIAKLKEHFCKLTAQKEEVSDLKLVSLNYLENNYTNSALFVPHCSKYYQYILCLLKEIISF